MELKKNHNTKTKGFHRKPRKEGSSKIYDIFFHFKNLLAALDNVLGSLIRETFFTYLWSEGYEAGAMKWARLEWVIDGVSRFLHCSTFID